MKGCPETRQTKFIVMIYVDHEPKVLFDNGYLFTLEEFEKRYPDSELLPEFRAKVEYYRAHKDEIEAPYRAKAEADERYHRWDNIRLSDLIAEAEEKLKRLRYLFEFYEGYDNTKARELDSVIVRGNNALSHGYCGDNSRETRERLITFIELAEKQFKK